MQPSVGPKFVRLPAQLAVLIYATMVYGDKIQQTCFHF